MHTSTPLTLSISRSPLARLHSARRDEPHPLHATPSQVARYVARLQQAGRALSHAHEAATHSNLPAPEAGLLARRRTSVDVAIARQASLAARRIGTDRTASLATLNALFDLGAPPDPPLDATYAGDLLAVTLFPPLDSFGRALARLWLPWKGKRFDASTSTGHNYLTPGAAIFNISPQAALPSAIDRARCTDTVDEITAHRSPNVEADWRLAEQYLRTAYHSIAANLEREK